MAVNPEIKKLTEKIRHTGPADQVRESIAGGMDLTSEEASATRKLADQTENRQTKVESDFKTLQQEYTENGNGTQTTAEISLARDGEPVLADRLNRDFGNITAQFQQTNNKVDQTEAMLDSKKLNRDENESVTMAMLNPDIKKAIEDGEWDININTSNLEDGSVTKEKTDFLTTVLPVDNAVNIMPDKLSAIGDFYDPSNGQFANNVNTQNFKNTGKIFLTKKGVIESYGNNSLVFKDSKDEFISSTQHGSDEEISVVRRITPPENSAYFIANVPKPYWWDNDDTLFPQLTARLMFIEEKAEIETLRVTDGNLEKVKDGSFTPENVFEKITLTNEGKVIDVKTGNELSQAGRKHSNWIEALPVHYKTYGVAHILFKMVDDTFMNTYYDFNNDTDLSTWQTWTPPKGAKLMAINLVTHYFERAEFFQMETNVLANYLPNLDVGRKINNLKRFRNDKMVQFGDSIIASNGSPSDIPSIIANDLHADVSNMGFGGTRAASHPNEHFNNFSFNKLVDAVISGNFTAQETSSSATGIGMPTYFKEKISMLKSINFRQTNLIIISYGTNDWNGIVPLDNPENPIDTTTYIGALRYSIIKLLESYPHLKIVITTPVYRFKEDGSQDSDDWVAGDKKISDFVDALIALGKELKMPVIDCYYALGINKYNRLHYFPSVDGTHLNYNGRKLLAHKHARGIMNAY